MSLFDVHAYPAYSAHFNNQYHGDFLGWRSEVAARIRDFFVRKAIPASERLFEGVVGLVHRLESVVPALELKSAVKELLAAWRQEKLLEPAEAFEAELTELFERIRAYRRQESIENYSAFLFSVDIAL